MAGPPIPPQAPPTTTTAPAITASIIAQTPPHMIRASVPPQPAVASAVPVQTIQGTSV